MASEFPHMEILDYLEQNWDYAQLSLAAGTVEFYPGVHDRTANNPSIAVHRGDEGPIDGGETGHTGMTAGGVMQRRGGTSYVECSAGTRDDCRGIKAGGGDLNPGTVVDELAQHVEQLIINAGNTTNLKTVAPGEPQLVVEGGGDAGSLPAFHRIQYPIRYTRSLRPSQ